LALNRAYTQNPLLGLAGVKECKRLITEVTASTFRVMQKKAAQNIGRHNIIIADSRVASAPE
jgi:hypothetical protein